MARKWSAVLVLAAATADPVPYGPTFGTGLAGVGICAAPKVVLNHTLGPGTGNGVLHHFWVTGAAGVIDRIWVEYYIDNETEPSIAFQPAMMCGFAFSQYLPSKDYEFSAGGLCGKTAPIGGWHNTFPIPFYASAVVTVRLDPADGAAGCSGSYVNLRGTERQPLALPALGPLPGSPRLMLQRNAMATRQPLEFVTLATLPAGYGGLIFQTAWAVEAQPVGGPSAGGGYIEGCWNFYARANETYPGVVVGTGVEDYFDSAYYFGADSGDATGTLFANALSGLTLFQRADPYERLSAYRFHHADPLWMVDGGALTWQVGCSGHVGASKCGNPLPAAAEGEVNAFAALHSDGRSSSVVLGRTLSAVNVTTYAWVFVWPGLPPPPPPPPPPATVGCADGTCDAFCANASGTVHGCVATWSGSLSLRAPPTGRGCGGALGPCASPADACAQGWALCMASQPPQPTGAAIADFRAGMDPGACAAGDARVFVAGMSHAQPAWQPLPPGPCPAAQSDADNGCAAAGWGAEPVCCGAGCAVPSCPSEIWPNATRIHIDEADGCGALRGGSADGVLCCRLAVAGVA